MNSEMNDDDTLARATAGSLSAYMDGELAVEQRDGLLQTIKADPDLRQDWLLYHCIGDVLRSDDAVQLRSGFGARMNAQLESEPYLFAPEVAKAFAARRSSPNVRWRAPVAVAASVLAAVTTGWVVWPQPDALQTARAPAHSPQVLVPAPAAVPPVASAAPPTVLAASGASTPAAADAAMSNAEGLRAVSAEYLMAHRSHSNGLAMRGVVSHVRTAGYDGQ